MTNNTDDSYRGFRCCSILIGFSFLALAILFLIRNTYCVYHHLQYELIIQQKRIEENPQKDVFTHVVVPNISNPFYFLNGSSLYCLEASVINVFDGLFNVGLLIGAASHVILFVRLWLAGEAVLFTLSTANIIYLVANGGATYETAYVMIILYVISYCVVYKFMKNLKMQNATEQRCNYLCNTGYLNYF